MKIKTDFLYIALIFIILILGFITSYGHIVSVYSDIGREFYVPWQMNMGEVLYKDIFNVYGALGYQINAFMMKIFSNEIYSLYIAGFISSFLALVAVYFITENYTNKNLAFLTSILTMVTCVFCQSISNYIAPYSYSVLYAMTAFLWSLLMLVKYIKQDDSKYLFLSSLFMGISICIKYEYCLFMLLILVSAIYKKEKFKHYVYSLLSFISPIILSFSILLIQGCTIIDLFEAGKYIVKLSTSESVKYFYTYTGFIPSLSSFVRNIFYLFDFSCFLLVFFAIPYFTMKLFKRLDFKYQVIIASIFLFVVVNLVKNLFAVNSVVHFSYIGYLAVILFIFYLVRNKVKDFSLTILFLATILTSVKVFGSINFNFYGTFFLPVFLILIATLIFTTKENKNIYYSLLLTICCFIYLYVYVDVNNIVLNKQNVINSHSKIHTNNSYFAKRYNEIVKYLQDNTTKEDKVLVLPEGSMLNYLAKRNSDNMYYYLIPPNVEIFTQESIIDNLSKNKPNYIVLFYNTYNWYNTTSFSNGYAKNIQKFIDENYIVDMSASSEYDKIYKLKDKK